MARSNEPAIWWLFSAGGVMTALFLPVTLLLTGVAVPAGWLEEETLLDLIRHPLARLYLLALISLSLFHWAHRFRYASWDLGIRGLGIARPIVLYGTAFTGTVAAAYFVSRL